MEEVVSTIARGGGSIIAGEVVSTREGIGGQYQSWKRWSAPEQKKVVSTSRRRWSPPAGGGQHLSTRRWSATYNKHCLPTLLLSIGEV